MGIRKFVAGAMLGVAMMAATAARGADALNRAVPLAVAQPAVSAGGAAASLAAAQRAQEIGLPTVAIGLYQDLLAMAGADRAAITLPLATALLDAGRAAEAEQVLNAAPGGRGNEWRLRMGLAQAAQGRFDNARNEADRVNVDQLTRPDRAWFWFLQAVLADAATPRDRGKADANYRLAEKEAPSEMALATFLAAGLRVRLTAVSYSALEIENARKLYQANQDKGSRAYGFAEEYAVMLAATNRKDEAVRLIRDVLLRVPRAEREWTDEFRRLLGVIGDRSRGGSGREALTQLLENGTVADKQRQALQLLAADSQREPERGLFRAELDKLLAAGSKSPILDGILLVRAELALTDNPKDYATAERRANELKDKFPGSSLRPHAFVVLATSAWEQHRYRVAADNARQAREALAAMPAATSPTEAKVVAQTTAELRVLEAEARFRAQDYRLAADAYAAALTEPPAGIPPGDLIFQRALAEIRADADDPTKDLPKLIDELEADARFDPTNRWEAEWTLARGLVRQGKTEAALGRVTKLLNSPEAQSAAISPELRARMAWLQARLASDAQRPELTIELVAKLDPLIAPLNPELRTTIASMAALMKAGAEFKLGHEKAATETLAKLRTDYATSDAAIYSYIQEADYYAEPGRDQVQKAQTALRTLVDEPKYKASPYVCYALFQLALLSERLGQENNLKDADHLIEELVDEKRNPPAPPELVFTARLKQGDLLRLLNEFDRAQVAYEDLVNNPKYGQQRDVVLAQLRLAECHNARSSTDGSGAHADLAQSMFEELLYRVAAPPDVRVEAGYNLGKLLERRGQFEKAREVWWRDVITPFFIDNKEAIPPGAKRPYWLAKTLLDLGELLAQREKIDEARRVYVVLRDSHLGYGETMAIEALKTLGVPSATTTPEPAAAAPDSTTKL